MGSLRRRFHADYVIELTLRLIEVAIKNENIRLCYWKSPLHMSWKTVNVIVVSSE